MKKPTWLNKLEPVRRHLLWQKMWQSGKMGIWIGLLVGLCWLIIARVTPMLYVQIGALALVVLGILAGLIYAIIYRPDWWQAITWSDQYFQLGERLITSWQMREHTGAIQEWQEKDATDHLVKKIAQNGRKWPFHWGNQQELYGSLLLVGIWVFLMFYPNPMTNIAIKQHKVEMAIEQQSEKIAKQAKKVETQSQISQKTKKELKKELSKLQESLQQTKSLQAAAEQLAKSEAELKKLQAKMANTQQTSEKLQEIFAQDPNLSKYSDQLQEGKDPKALAQALQKAWSKMTPEQRKKSAQQFAKAGKELSQSKNPDQQKAGKDLQQAAKQIKKNGQKWSQSVASAAQKGQQEQQDQQTINKTAQAVTKGKEQLIGGNTSQNIAKGPNNQGQQQNGSQGQQQKGKQGSNNGGPSNQTGQSNQSGSNSNQSGSGTQGKGQGSQNWVFAPSKKIPGGGSVFKEKGPLGKKGQEQQVGSVTSTTAGLLLPYDQVFASYQKETRKAIENGDLPPEWQAWVRDYFSSLEP